MRPVNRYAISAMLSLLTVAGAAAQRAASHPEAGGTAGAAYCRSSGPHSTAAGPTSPNATTSSS